MMKSIICICLVGLLFSCDTKSVNISGTIVNKTTGAGLGGCLINYSQCKVEEPNCTEMVMAQVMTNSNGEFIIDHKVASKAKNKWITVFLGNKKLIQVDNIGLNDKNLIIQVTP